MKTVGKRTGTKTVVRQAGKGVNAECSGRGSDGIEWLAALVAQPRLQHRLRALLFYSIFYLGSSSLARGGGGVGAVATQAPPN